MIYKLLILFSTALLISCTSKIQEQPLILPKDCNTAYIYAPANYIIEVASGSEVILDPSANEFPLFCSPEDARKAVNNEISNNKLPKGDWRIYQLEGNFEDLAQSTEQNKFILRRMANITDWIVEK